MARRKTSRKIVRWTRAELQTLKKQAGKVPLDRLARLFKRTAAAVQLKASKAGISLRQR